MNALCNRQIAHEADAYGRHRSSTVHPKSTQRAIPNGEQDMATTVVSSEPASSTTSTEKELSQPQIAPSQDKKLVFRVCKMHRDGGISGRCMASY